MLLLILLNVICIVSVFVHAFNYYYLILLIVVRIVVVLLVAEVHAPTKGQYK